MKAEYLGIFCVILLVQLVREAASAESNNNPNNRAYGNYNNGAYGVFGRGFQTPTLLSSEPQSKIFLYIFTNLQDFTETPVNAQSSWHGRSNTAPPLLRPSNTQGNTQPQSLRPVHSNTQETTENNQNNYEPQPLTSRDVSPGYDKFATDMLFVS